MIEMLTTIDTGTCINCGLPIELLKGDLTREPHWTHTNQGDGALRRECPGSLYATPRAKCAEHGLDYEHYVDPETICHPPNCSACHPSPVPTDKAERIAALETELIEWAEGRRSNHNTFMTVEGNPENRQQTLVAVAQADAAEVQKLGAALAALRGSIGPPPGAEVEYRSDPNIITNPEGDGRELERARATIRQANAAREGRVYCVSCGSTRAPEDPPCTCRARGRDA